MRSSSYREIVLFVSSTIRRVTGRDYSTYFDNASREVVESIYDIVSSSEQSCLEIVKILSQTTGEIDTKSRINKLANDLFSGNVVTSTNIPASIPVEEKIEATIESVPTPTLVDEPAEEVVDVPVAEPVVDEPVADEPDTVSEEVVEEAAAEEVVEKKTTKSTKTTTSK